MKKITSHSKETKIYNIHYRSENSYVNKVKSGILDFLLIPDQSDDQELLSYHFVSDPILDHAICTNHLGFQIIRFFITQHLHDLTIDFYAEVLKRPNTILEKDLSSHRNQYPHQFLIDNFFYFQNTDFTDLPAKSDFILKRGKSENLLQFIVKVSEMLHNRIKYEQHVTDVYTKAKEVVKIKAGVCQDFSHVLIGIYRTNGIAARYVSGYLYTAFHEAQLHAWVEAYIPEMGWIGIDPANNCFINEKYIKIAHGTDYRECAAIKGTIESHGDHTTVYSVKVDLMEQQIKQSQS